MTKRSAGLLVYRRNAVGDLEVLIAHMGGPFWAKKDERAWSIPKGEYDEGEDPRAAAVREFQEELGAAAPTGDLAEIGVAQQSGKVIVAFAIEGDIDLAGFHSNTFEMEWPPRSGKRELFPEVDKAAWVGLDRARFLVSKGQVPLIDALRRHLERKSSGSAE
jgi:predicted NUDIX family NTP pyrophosphohydrolase